MTDDTDEFAAFVCGVQRIANHRKEQRQIAETLVEGVPLDRLRAIRDAGGLAKLLEAFDGLHSGCNIALPYLWNSPLEASIDAHKFV